MNGNKSFRIGAEVVLRMMLGAIFMAAGFSKLIRPSEYFQIVIGLYEIVPARLIPTVANVFPWLEFVFGFNLLVGYASRKSAAAVTILAFMFFLVLTQAFVRQLPLYDCGCFGDAFHFKIWQSMIADGIMVLVGLWLSAIPASFPFSLDRWIESSSENDPIES